tara:strand:- start:2074 stop:3618 length:1545 start_codon:yes stop_codon:yes gene_type:complete
MSNKKIKFSFPTAGSSERFEVDLEGTKYQVIYNTNPNSQNFLNIVSVKKRSGLSWQPVGPTIEGLVKNHESTKLQFAKNLAVHKLGVNQAGDPWITEVGKAADLSGNGELWANVAVLENEAAKSLVTEGLDLTKTVNVNSNFETDLNVETETTLGEVKKVPSIENAAVLSYPLNAYKSEKNVQDHIIIEAFKYRAPQEQLAPIFKGNWDEMATLKEPDGKKGAESFIKSATKGLPRNSNIQKYHGLVKLPIPNELQMSNGISWGDESANAFTTAAFLGATNTIRQKGADPFALLGASATGTKDIVSGLTNGQGSNEDFKTLASAFGAQFALGSIGINVDPGQMITRATGKAINPNLELLFNGPKLRNFSFNFLFAPNDPNEASEVRKIQKFLKKCMSPSRNSGNRLFIDTPDVFRIRFRSGNDRIGGVGMIKICAMTKCAINYSPENTWMSYSDKNAGAMPVRSNMSCDFTELTPIFQDHYEDGVWKSSFADLRDLQVPNGANAFQEQTDDVGF